MHFHQYFKNKSNGTFLTSGYINLFRPAAISCTSIPCNTNPSKLLYSKYLEKVFLTKKNLNKARLIFRELFRILYLMIALRKSGSILCKTYGRSRHRRCSIKKALLKTSQYSPESTCVGVTA